MPFSSKFRSKLLMWCDRHCCLVAARVAPVSRFTTSFMRTTIRPITPFLSASIATASAGPYLSERVVGPQGRTGSRGVRLTIPGCGLMRIHGICLLLTKNVCYDV
jgi:hypothetical protein